MNFCFLWIYFGDITCMLPLLFLFIFYGKENPSTTCYENPPTATWEMCTHHEEHNKKIFVSRKNFAIYQPKKKEESQGVANQNSSKRLFWINLNKKFTILLPVDHKKNKN